MNGGVARWLLRTLVEPAFLRYYALGPDEPLAPSTFEAEFFGLKEDCEHPADDRTSAWNRLHPWILDQGASAAERFRRILHELRACHDLRPRLHALARFWALPELFDDPPSPGFVPSPTEPCAPPYHELHCHFRGGVPYLVLWQGYMDDARLRAALRRLICFERPAQTTWAELVERLAPGEDIVASGGIDQICERAVRLDLVRRVRTILASGGSLEHVPYVATCAGLARFLLHQRSPEGLASFSASYDRYSEAQKSVGRSDELTSGAMVQQLLRRFEADGVAAIEVRPTLENTRAKLQRKLRGLARGYLDYVKASEHPVAMGLVPSLFKQEHTLKAKPIDSAFWQEQQDLWRNQVEILLEVLRDDPALRWLVVGLDAAGQERGCPPSALAPAFQLIHRYNQGTQHARPGRMMSPLALRTLLAAAHPEPLELLAARSHWHSHRIRLGITVHAGEDFEDPLTGLRHIWETVEALTLESGDRLGHALAAGLAPGLLEEFLRRRYPRDPEASSAQYTTKPRGTHLLDLAWVARVAPSDPERREAIAQLGQLCSRLFGVPAATDWVLHELRETVEIPRLAIPGARYLAGEELGEEQRESVVFDARWRQRFEGLRQHILGLLVRKRIVVESCPTSNLVVAGLPRPPLTELLQVSGLRVAVATDDPGLLNSYPARELEFVPAPYRQRVLRTAKEASFVWLPDTE